MGSNRNRERGKDCERYIAKRLSGRRVGILQGEDVEHKKYSIEVKSRVRFAGENFMTQAVRNCPNDKIPLVVVHIKNKSHDNDLVILNMTDFERLTCD